MSLDALIILSGALVAFLSVAGFPPSWYKPMFFILGIFTVILGIVVRRRGMGRQVGEHREVFRNVTPIREHEEVV